MDMPMESKKKGSKPEAYEIECWADHIIKAEEIKADPEKMKYVKPVLEKRMMGMKKAISSIADLKAVAQEKGTEETPADKKEDMSEGEYD